MGCHHPLAGAVISALVEILCRDGHFEHMVHPGRGHPTDIYSELHLMQLSTTKHSSGKGLLPIPHPAGPTNADSWAHIRQVDGPVILKLAVY